MTVREVPVVDLLTFQVWDRDGGSWTDLADKATSVDMQRGATQSGAKVETQVGTLDAQLYGALDLRRRSDLQPNSPIRVIRPPLAPAIAWDLMPTTAEDQVASKGLLARNVEATVNGASTTLSLGQGIFNGSIQANWNNYSPDVTAVAAGALLFASPNTYVANPTNNRPVGRFDRGDTYTVKGTLRSGDTTIVQRVRVVIYSGSAASPTVLAQSDPITATDAGTAIAWTFTAPDASDWNVAIAAADTITASTSRALFNLWVAKLTIWDTGRQRPEFTGTVSDIYQSVEYDKSTNEEHIFTTVQAVDAVQSLANTDRYGAIATSGAGYQTWADRIQQLATSSFVPIDAPADADTAIYDQAGGVSAAGWLQRGTATPANQWYAGGDGKGAWSVYRLPNTGTAAGTFSGVTVAQQFRTLDRTAGYAAVLTVTVRKRVGITPGDWSVGFGDGPALAMTWGDSIDMSVTTPQTLAVRFNPGTQQGAVGIFQRTGGQLAAGATTALTIAISDMRVVKIGAPDAYVLQDVGYESSLLNHFDLACNSVGARWYVTKRGTALFRRQLEDTDPVARFSDTNAGDVSYTDVALGYDTRNVVTSLKLNQHGYDPATGNTADESMTFTQDVAIARWGARASELDTCLYLGAPHTADASQRAREVMGPLRRPKYTVTSFTFNAQSKLDVLDVLELRSTIAVDYKDVHQQSRVLGVQHSITPTQWMVTVTVNESRVGARFRDLTAAGNGTFAAFNAAHDQTFRDYNADPLE